MRKVIPIVIIAVVISGGLVFAWPTLQNSAFACQLTESNPQGPYYIAGAPFKEKFDEVPGQRLIITGTVMNQDCDVVPNAIIDLWQTDSNGNYYFEDFTLRGKVVADEHGQYTIDTIFPGSYSEGDVTRPSHIHLKISAPDTTSHTTQLYFEGDENHDFMTRYSLVLSLNEQDGVLRSNFNFIIFTP